MQQSYDQHPASPLLARPSKCRMNAHKQPFLSPAPSTPMINSLLTALETARCLPWQALVDEISLVLQDDSVRVAPRQVQTLAGGGSLFVMPAFDRNVAITKLITFTPGNAAVKLPTIQGDVVVFDVASGQRRLVLDGPTVTGRRTAAVSALAAQRLAANTRGPLLIVGAGVQALAHLEVFAEVLKVQEVVIASRSLSSAEALARHARTLGLKARVTDDANAALADCPLAVTCTPASTTVLSAHPRDDGFISAVGAFTSQMAELSTGLCRYMAQHGEIFVDTADASHEAGDLLQAGLDVPGFRSLAAVAEPGFKRPVGPVLFKSCGWAGWDLTAARVALASA